VIAQYIVATLPQADENVLVPKASELIIGIISFGVLVAGFFWLAWPNVKRVYAERAERIEGGLERAEQAQREAQETLEQYRAQLAEARSEANRIRQEAHEQGREIIEDLRREAQTEAAELRQRAEEQLAAERSQVVASLRREVGTLAVDLATRIVGRELSNDTRQRQLVDDFIGALETQDSAARDSAAGPSR
jgi:F-type H+-transporting ATPase subunit b